MVAQSLTKKRQQLADNAIQLIKRLEATNETLLASLEKRSLLKEDSWDESDDAIFERGLAEVQENRKQIAELRSQLDAGENTRANEGSPMVHLNLPDHMTQKSPTPRADLFETVQDGRHVRAVRNTEKLSDGSAGIRPGDYIKAILTNDWSEVPSKTRMEQTAGSDSAGGYLLPSPVAQDVLDLARSNSVALRAGAQTLPMTTSELSLVRLTGDPTAVWRGETQTITASEATFDKVVLRPKVVACNVPISVELLEDSENAAAAIEMAIRGSIGAAMDLAILDGTGAANEPLGIRNDTNTNSITSVGTPTNYDAVSNAIGDIRLANYPGETSDLAWIHHPREGDTYSNLKTGISSDNTPLVMPARVAELMRFETTAVDITEGGGGAESYMIVGDFSQCIVGMRTQITIRMAQDGTVTDGTTTWNLTSDLMRSFIAYVRLDTAIMRPTWFTVLSGVTNT